MKAPAGDRRARLRAMLADLKTPGALESVDGSLHQADSGAVTATEAIDELLSAQIPLRSNRRLEAALLSLRLPAVETLDQFDFSFQPSIKREQIESLHEPGFLERAENVILLGPPGAGKTHFAISLTIAAAEPGRKRLYYGTLAALIESLTKAKAAGNLPRRLRVLTHPDLLVVDEIGYLPISQDGSSPITVSPACSSQAWARSTTATCLESGGTDAGNVLPSGRPLPGRRHDRRDSGDGDHHGPASREAVGKRAEALQSTPA